MKKNKIKITPKETLAKKINIPKNLGAGVGINAGDPLVIIKDISKTYGKEELFSGARMRVMAGDRIAIVGANGMGKTTLLKIIIGIEEADEG
ncbi:MAG: ATP-binding cassette domain-containing protein, partial [Minisyncoccales bacterium]